MQGPLTDPITSLVLDVAIGGAVGWVGKIATDPPGWVPLFSPRYWRSTGRGQACRSDWFWRSGGRHLHRGHIWGSVFRDRMAPNVGTL